MFGDEEEPIEPIHDRGFIADERGLYFLGLYFLGLYFLGLYFVYAASSALLRGVGRDADRVVKDILARDR